MVSQEGDLKTDSCAVFERLKQTRDCLRLCVEEGTLCSLDHSGFPDPEGGLDEGLECDCLRWNALAAESIECDGVGVIVGRGPEGRRGALRALLDEHILASNGRCARVKAHYKDRHVPTDQLALDLGELRFAHGMVAFPDALLFASDGKCYLLNVKRCVICAGAGGRHRDRCKEVCERFTAYLTDTELDGDYGRKTPLYTKMPSERSVVGPRTADNIFKELGSREGMSDELDTVDACGVQLSHFVAGDNMVREHVYHVHVAGVEECGFLAKKFFGKESDRKSMVGKERYRRGYVAFPELMLEEAVEGYVGVGYKMLCVSFSNLKRALVPEERSLVAKSSASRSTFKDK